MQVINDFNILSEYEHESSSVEAKQDMNAEGVGLDKTKSPACNYLLRT